MGKDKTGASQLDVSSLISKADSGDRRAIGRLLTTVESGAEPEVRLVIDQLYPRAGNAWVIGLTGAPGAGKSTLVSALAGEIRRRDRSVAILAVDPSSSLTGGAFLGDRIRMESHYMDRSVYIRSLASRGKLGGLSFAVPHATIVLDALGFEAIIIETVGVGQSEADITKIADSVGVVLAPGMGDSIQAAKAGISEIADVFVVNKSDQPGANQLASQVRDMLQFGPAGNDESHRHKWLTQVAHTTAIREDGVSDLMDILESHRKYLQDSGKLEELRRRRILHMVREIVLQRLRSQFEDIGGDKNERFTEMEVALRHGHVKPYSAADMLMPE